MAIQGIETLECFAMFGKIQTTIGQYAIDIEECHLHALCLEQQLGRKIQSGLNGLHEALGLSWSLNA
jgi:hypothetical protein